VTDADSFLPEEACVTVGLHSPLLTLPSYRQESPSLCLPEVAHGHAARPRIHSPIRQNKELGAGRTRGASAEDEADAMLSGEHPESPAPIITLEQAIDRYLREQGTAEHPVAQP
jgi:hypothetical protein